MATYGGGGILKTRTYESSGSIASNNGVIFPNQTLHTTATDVIHTDFTFTGFANVAFGTTAGANFLIRIEKQGISYSNWYSVGTIGFEGSANNNSEGPLLVTSVTSKGAARMVSDLRTGTVDPFGNKFRLFPGERLVLESGTCSDGLTFRITWEKVTEYNSI